jgi:hypothetical protein
MENGSLIAGWVLNNLDEYKSIPKKYKRKLIKSLGQSDLVEIDTELIKKIKKFNKKPDMKSKLSYEIGLHPNTYGMENLIIQRLRNDLWRFSRVEYWYHEEME